jgi:CRP-like cAMP-binding protein
VATSEALARREVLARVPVFAGLASRELDELAAVAHTRRLRPREELFHKGDEGTQVFVIVRGRLRVGTTSAEGSDVLFRIMNPGEVFGELALLAGGERTATVSAIDECELLVLDRRDFLPFLRSHPELAIHLLEVLAERLRNISELVEDTVFLNLPARLAKKLLGLAEDYGTEVAEGVRIEMKLSQQELGTMVGTSRESVNKQMRQWEEEGIVRSDRGTITILRPRELESLAGAASP